MSYSELPVVHAVDDDPCMLSAIRRLLASANLAAELYESGGELLSRARFDRPGCILLDVCMPGMSGLEVQNELNRRQVTLPVIFLTGLWEVPAAVTAMREGAVDYIEKPFDDELLLARVLQAIERNRQHRSNDIERNAIVQKFNLLTEREHAVLELLASGKNNKQIARLLGNSHRTVEVHRHHVMEKMSASTIGDLIRMRLLIGKESGVPEKN